MRDLQYFHFFHSIFLGVEFCQRGLQTQTLAAEEKRPYIRNPIRFVSHTELQYFFSTNIVELDFLVKNLKHGGSTRGFESHLGLKFSVSSYV